MLIFIIFIISIISIIFTIFIKIILLKKKQTNCSLIEEHRLFLHKEKCIYHTLNMMSIENNLFFGYCWCPKDREEHVNKTLNFISSSKGFSTSQLHKLPAESSTPPTSFGLTDFTKPFQVFNKY